jgi:hypothetical protein
LVRNYVLIADSVMDRAGAQMMTNFSNPTPAKRLGDLSFVDAQGDRKPNLWAHATQRVGDYADDCAVGVAAAEELCAYVRDTDDLAILGGIAQVIANNGRFSGKEVGFFAGLSRQLSQG